jgi:hypothetical protein
MRRGLGISLAILLAVAVGACLGTKEPIPDPTRSRAAAIRIQTIAKDTDWYGILNRVKGLPDVTVYPAGHLGDGPDIEVILVESVDAKSELVKKACAAIFAGLNDGSLGPSMGIDEVQLVSTDINYLCTA